MNEELEKIKKSLRINRILLLLVLVLFVFIIVGGFVAFSSVSKVITVYKPTIDSLARIDLAKISTQLNSINIPEFTGRVDRLDADLSGLAAAFKDLKEIMEPISALAAQRQR